MSTDTHPWPRAVEIEVPKRQASSGFGGPDGRMRYYAHCQVEEDGDVLVYDSVAGHLTRCHSLTPEQIEEARRRAGFAAVGA